MGIAHKHAYRFGFLKSEEWSGFRKIALSQKHARCEICHREDWSNDVHHVRYRKNPNKPQWSDFRVLCRTCHGLVHIVMEHRKKMGARDNHQRHWWNIRRSAKRIWKIAIACGSLEVATARAMEMFRQLEFARASVKGPPNGSGRVVTTGSAGDIL